MTRTTNSKVSVPANGSLMISPEIKAFLPDVLIEYLWKIVLNGKWKAYEKQSFILQSEKLSGRDVQDIYHMYDNNNSPDIRRVYGVKPVNCTLQVFDSGGCYKMQLYTNI